MHALSRRRVLSVLVAAPAAALASLRPRTARAQGLGGFSAGPPPCKPDEKATPAVSAGPEFKPGSPTRTSLVEPEMPGVRLTLTGTVSGLTCGPVAGARLDFWQADASGHYDANGFRLRGHQTTDRAGSYRLETVVPGAHGRQAPSLHVRVEAPKQAPFTTRLFFPDEPLNAADPEFRPELVMRVTTTDGRETARYDITLNI